MRLLIHFINMTLVISVDNRFHIILIIDGKGVCTIYPHWQKLQIIITKWFWALTIYLDFSCSIIMTWERLPNFWPLWHDDVIKWKHFPRNWPFVREIHRSPVNFPHKGQWRGALMFSLIYAWINGWINNREAGDLRRQHGHYDVIVMR